MLVRYEFNIDSRYRQRLEGLGLRSFHSLWRFTPGKIIRYGPFHELLYGVLGPRGPGLYLKRTRFEGWRCLYRSLWDRRVPRSVCLKEVDRVQRLQRLNIHTARPVAWGQGRLLNLVPWRGFVLFEEVEGVPGERFFADGNPEERRQLAREMGRLVGRLHGEGFFDVMRVDDVVVRKEDARLRLYLIDRAVRTPEAQRFSRGECFRALRKAVYFFFKYGNRFNAWEARAFLDAYVRHAGTGWKLTARELLRELREKYPHYEKKRARFRGLRRVKQKLRRYFSFVP